MVEAKADDSSLRAAAKGNDKEQLGSEGKVKDDGDAADDGDKKGAAAEEQPASMFVDAEDMKAKIRAAAYKEEYDVSKFYVDEGIWQAIARDGVFEKVTLSVIAFNALWIAIDTDLNYASVLLDADPIFQIAEHGFCIYFSFEWYCRFKSFRRKRDGLKDGWFVFDSCLVFMMVGETWVMNAVLIGIGGTSGGLGNASILRMARLLRLSRMARMARLFRAMPELLILIKGMVAATRSVFFTLCLLGIIIYVFGIAFRQLVGEAVLDDEGEAYFGSVPKAMHTLFLDGTLMDGTGTVVKALLKEGWFYSMLFYFFILLAALTVMNMLIGVLCEVVSAVAATEKEAITVSFVKGQIEKVMAESGMDENGDGMISKEEFSKVLEYPEAVDCLNEVGVDVLNLVDNIDFIFNEEEGPDGIVKERELSFSDFMELVLTLRGSNTATVKDIVDLRKFISSSHARMRDEIRRPRTSVNTCPSSPTLPPPDMPEQWEPGSYVKLGEVKCANVMDEKLLKQTKDVNDMNFDAQGLPSTFLASRASWVPAGLKPEESEMWHRRARLVDALVTAQAELQRFMETLPACEAFDGSNAASLLSLPSLPGHPGLAEEPRQNLLSSGCGKTPLALTGPLRVRWLPGELSELQGQLGRLQKAVASSLGGLQKVRERFSPVSRPGPNERDRSMLNLPERTYAR